MYFIWTLFILFQTLIILKKDDPYKKKLYTFTSVVFSIFLLFSSFVVAYRGFFVESILLLSFFLLNITILILLSIYNTSLSGGT
ncbi:MAG: hypothetical protein QME48_06405 [bacterium]|uniref:Uncharacterized protein n=1 Tax=candidate division WOR-3 bacterium TaxID=2052148 RepID=A0A348MIU7_UNCW3|nr:hypothetical protein [bacterium]HAF06973.1 hypothetical protein [candidate division WOR-3 bacterium]HCP16887.1 hypothetical protein [candidate division WOR-3 bacterium]